MKASSAGVSLGLLGDLWARESPDGQSKGAGAHVGYVVGEVRLDAVLLPVNCCCIIPPESVKLDLSTEVRDFPSGTLAAMCHVVSIRHKGRGEIKHVGYDFFIRTANSTMLLAERMTSHSRA